jgi:hypothetical protein
MYGEVEPFAGRSSFELEVSFWLVCVRGDENLAHVSIP